MNPEWPRRRDLAWTRVAIGALLFVGTFSQLEPHPEWAIVAFIGACLLEAVFVVMLAQTYVARNRSN
jgi:hypothetical protein